MSGKHSIQNGQYIASPERIYYVQILDIIYAFSDILCPVIGHNMSGGHIIYYGQYIASPKTPLIMSRYLVI